jgi:hypothetical protein
MTECRIFLLNCHEKRIVNSRGDTSVELVNSFDWKVGCGEKQRVQMTQDTAK